MVTLAYAPTTDGTNGWYQVPDGTTTFRYYTLGTVSNYPGWTTGQDLVWSNWSVSTTQTTTINATMSDDVWQDWNKAFVRQARLANDAFVQVSQALQRTPEEIAAEAARLAAAEAARHAQRLRDEAESREATARAQRLLEENLTDDQRRTLQEKGYFVVKTDKNVYRIYRGRSGNVRRATGGRESTRYCIHPTELVPNEDTMLAQKLMLEHDEPEFLRIANAS